VRNHEQARGRNHRGLSAGKQPQQAQQEEIQQKKLLQKRPDRIGPVALDE